MGQFTTRDISNNGLANKIALELETNHNITFEDQMGLNEVMIMKDGEIVDYDELDNSVQELLNKVCEYVEIDTTINEAVEEAEESFWNEITNYFPNIKSGDLSPEMTIELQGVMKKAVKEWVKNNS